jgi:hypothetical protein
MHPVADPTGKLEQTLCCQHYILLGRRHPVISAKFSPAYNLGIQNLSKIENRIGLTSENWDYDRKEIESRTVAQSLPFDVAYWCPGSAQVKVVIGRGREAR